MGTKEKEGRTGFTAREGKFKMLQKNFNPFFGGRALPGCAIALLSGPAQTEPSNQRQNSCLSSRFQCGRSPTKIFLNGHRRKKFNEQNKNQENYARSQEAGKGRRPYLRSEKHDGGRHGRLTQPYFGSHAARSPYELMPQKHVQNSG